MDGAGASLPYVALVKCIKLFNTYYNCVCVVALPFRFFACLGFVGSSYVWQSASQFRTALNLLFYFIRDSNGIFVSHRTLEVALLYQGPEKHRIEKNNKQTNKKKKLETRGNAKRNATAATEDENFSHQTFSKYATVPQFDYYYLVGRNAP